jgi:hypothetical protein
MVLTVSFVLPGDRLVVTVACGSRFCWARSGSQNSANLTPAPGRQDHTTSPSASASLVCARCHRSQVFRPALRSPSRSTLPRPLHPAPYVRDDRETPLCVGRDGRTCRDDLPDGESGIFFEMGLDWANQIDPAQQIPFFAQIRKTAGGTNLTGRCRRALHVRTGQMAVGHYGVGAPRRWRQELRHLRHHHRVVLNNRTRLRLGQGLGRTHRRHPPAGVDQRRHHRVGDVIAGAEPAHDLRPAARRHAGVLIHRLIHDHLRRFHDARLSADGTFETCRMHRAMSEFEQSGKQMLALSSSQFDPKATFR